MRGTLFEPELIWNGHALAAGVLAVNASGEIVHPVDMPAGATRVRLAGRALLPGLVNAHSHAFQRLLRGRTEYRAKGNARDDFWSWRERMYTAALRLDPEGLHAASRQAFVEMALAGITTVGEFHYLHHGVDGSPYQERNMLARAVIRAAREVGLRVVLLRVGYARGGYGAATDPRQRRFLDASPEAWLEAAQGLASEVREDPLVTVQLAPHSVRALPREWLAALRASPFRLHMHVAEQPGEVEACLAEHGKRPAELLDELGLLSSRFTAVHGIHLARNEVERLGRARASVCACPSTERNLGDGVVLADSLLDAGIAVSLGSDSQVTIDLLDEARQLEGHLRLLRGHRNILDPGHGEAEGLAARLFTCATRSGAEALGLSTGLLEPGRPADFFTVDLGHPSLIGAEPDAVLGTLLAGGSTAAVRDVAVAGKLIVEGGRHPLAEATGRAFMRVVKECFA